MNTPAIALPMEAFLIHYESRVCAFCGQRKRTPCSTEEFRDCDDYKENAKTSNVAAALFQ